MNVFIQAIKLAPTLFWQLCFQPSKIVAFSRKNYEVNKNRKIFIISLIIISLSIGAIVGALHFNVYKNLISSIIFAFAGAFAGAVVAVAFAFASIFAFAGAFAGAVVAFAFAGAFAGAFAVAAVAAAAVAVAGVGAGAGAAVAVADVVAGAAEVVDVVVLISIIFATVIGISISNIISLYLLLFLGSVCFIIVFLKSIDKIELSDKTVAFLFLGAFVFYMTAGGAGFSYLKIYEILIYPFSFFSGYFLMLQLFVFVDNRNMENRQHIDIFVKIQKASMLFVVISLLLFFLAYKFTFKNDLNEKLKLIAIAFFIMPVFILHVPDYIICSFIFLFQRKTAKRKCDDSTELMTIYENSILFKIEMIYFQLPGLHKFIALFVKNNDLGIKTAIEKIDHLYSSTFQQKQAQKAVKELGKDKETAHLYINYLLETKSFRLIELLSDENPLAEAYMVIINKVIDGKTMQHDGELTHDGTAKHASPVLSDVISGFKPIRKKTELKGNVTLEDCVKISLSQMGKLEGYKFHEEIINSLRAAYAFLSLNKLEDFYAACNFLENIENFPDEIPYLVSLKNIAADLIKTSSDLKKINEIENFGTKREFLLSKINNFNVLQKDVEQSLYEPFAAIWSEALKKCRLVIEQEITVLQGSAEIIIEIKNTTLVRQQTQQNLYFTIFNKGQEMAEDISVEITTDSDAIEVSDSFNSPILEAGGRKEFFFPVIIKNSGNAVVNVRAIFSDRIKKGKEAQFSFKVEIADIGTRFSEIKNPYIIGNPLSVESPVYFERDGAYNFIKNNIVSGDEKHSIVCYGLRRTGKSTLLRKIQESGFDNKNLVSVFFDMQEVDDERDFYKSLADTVSIRVNIKTATKPVNFGQFKDFLKELKPGLNGRKIVLMIDEFEELELRVRANKLSDSVFSNIRHLMQYDNDLLFIFSGTHKLEEMSADYWSIFFNTALYIKLDYLDKQNAMRLIREPVKEQLTYDDLAAEHIYTMTHGQPYLTQLICFVLINNLNEAKKTNYANINDVDNAVEKIIISDADRFSPQIWASTDVTQHLVLSALAEETLSKQTDMAALSAIFDKIATVTKRFTTQDVLTAAKKLSEKGIFKELDSRYGFAVQLFRRWVYMKYPLRKVREEL